jgi:hypothetical protein
VRRLIILMAALIAIAAIFFAVRYYRYRFVRQNSDLVRLMPPQDLTLVYTDLDLLRKAQLIGLMAHIKVAPDQEYSDFIRETGFDYTRDLDAIVIGVDASQTFLVGRGKFDWQKLKDFTTSHHGTCTDSGCEVPATTPGRWVNLITVQPDVLAVAISSSPTAADNLRPPGRRVQQEIPNAPVWAKLSNGMLTNPTTLPLPLRIFAIDLQSASSVTVFATADRLQLHATFANPAAADSAKGQLQIQTRLLTSALQQSGEKADSASIAGMLTAGTFRTSGEDLDGTWPLRREFLRALE